MKTFFRYPGGKSKIANIIVPLLPEHDTYIEPFVGAGAIFLKVLEQKRFRKYIINDKNYAIFSIWHSIQNFPNELNTRLLNFVPSVEAYNDFKNILINHSSDIVETAFMKIALHQTSFSGLGEKSGGPIGGQYQSSKYAIDCRYNPERIANDISKISKLMQNVTVLNLDYEKVLLEGALYIDPPYYEVGHTLYQTSMTEDEHVKLHSLLVQKDNWLLSYDNCEFVKNLYSDCKIRTIEDLHYSINSKRSNFSNELLITKT